jgi:hypothetical protein
MRELTGAEKRDLSLLPKIHLPGRALSASFLLVFVCYFRLNDRRLQPRQRTFLQTKTVAQLNLKTIEALQEILRDEYGREISFAEAAEIAGALVGYFDLLARIYHREKNKDPNNS